MLCNGENNIFPNKRLLSLNESYYDFIQTIFIMSLEKKGSNKYIKLCYYEPLLLPLLVFYQVTYFGES